MTGSEPVTGPLGVVTEVFGELLHDTHEGMRTVVRGLPVEGLDWRPADGANSIGVLVAHALDAERFLIAAAADITFERDREAQFRVAGLSADDYIGLVDRVETEVDGFLARIRPDVLTATIERGPRVHAGPWWLLHPLEHAREHLGQAFLTRQLLEARYETAR